MSLTLAKSLGPKAISYIMNLSTTFTSIRGYSLYNALLGNLSWGITTKIIHVIILIARKMC